MKLKFEIRRHDRRGVINDLRLNQIESSVNVDLY